MNCKVFFNAALTSSEANLFALNFLSESKKFLSFPFSAILELSRQLKRVIWQSIGVFLSWAEIQFHLKMLKQEVLVRKRLVVMSLGVICWYFLQRRKLQEYLLESLVSSLKLFILFIWAFFGKIVHPSKTSPFNYLIVATFLNQSNPNWK